MENLTEPLAMATLLLSVLAFIATIFPGKRMRRLKVSGAAFLAFVGLALFAPWPRPEGLNAEASATNSPEPASTLKEPQKSAQDAQQERKAKEYHEKITAEFAEIDAFAAKDFTSNVTSILLAVEIMNAFTKSYAEGERLILSPEQKATRGSYRKKISEMQNKALPTLRDAYGPAMREALWEVDGEAKTKGTGFRTVEFINAAFAANRNIKTANDDLMPTLMKLRFTRAEYKWYRGESGFTYYNLPAPKDGDIVTWGPKGRFTLLD